jgi:hypothetical protein
MEPNFPTPSIAAAVDRHAAALAVPPIQRQQGLVITPPERLNGDGQIPYASTDRTPAGPLQELEAATAAHLDIDRRQLISREGEIREGGAACLFQVLAQLGDTTPIGWVIAAHREAGWSGNAKLRIRERRDEPMARALYRVAITALGDELQRAEATA